MAVFVDGSISGTVGGGPIEYQSILHAMDVLKSHESGIRDFILTPNQTADIGMICGGNATVYFRYVPADDRATAELFKSIGEGCF